MEELIASLKSSDPQRRRQAIIALGKSKNPAALKVLGDVYKTDPDAELRQLALEAGKYIRQYMAETPPPPPSQSAYTQSSSAGFGDDPGYEIVEPKIPKAQYGSTINIGGEVGDRDVARAKVYLDRAMSLHMSKNPGKAAEALIKAIEINPGLKRDAVAQGLAAAITHQPPEHAFEFLLNPAASQQFIKEKQRETRGERSEGSLTENLAAVGLDLATMTLVLTIGVVILFVLFVRALNDDGNIFEFDQNNPDSIWFADDTSYYGFDSDYNSFMDEMCAPYFDNPQLQAANPNDPCVDYVNQQRVNQAVADTYAETFNIDELKTAGVGISLVIGLVAGLATALSITIQMTCIHYVATILGGGIGSLAGLMKRMVPYFTILYGVLFGLAAIVLFDGSYTTLGLAYFGVMVMGLINLFTPVYLTMKAYRFGFMNGCGSYCLGGIISGFVMSFCQSALFAMLGQLISSAA